MKIIGFGLTRVLAEKSLDVQLKNLSLGTDIEFVDIIKEETSLAKDGSETLKVSFRFSVPYKEKDKKESKKGEVSIHGFIMIMATPDEVKDALKAWKKRELPNDFRIPLFNFILKKCSIHALRLEDELGLPLHIPMPQLKVGKQEEKK